MAPRPVTAVDYAELQVTTHFSFLRGVSSAEMLFTAAANLGIAALGIVDRNSVAGIVRAWEAARTTGVRLLPGCRIDLDSGESVLVWPQDRAGWSRLTRMLSAGRVSEPVEGRWLGKAPCRIGWDDLGTWSEGLIGALVMDRTDEDAARALGRMRDLFGDRAYAATGYWRRPGDIARIDAIDGMARAAGVTPVATGDVLYAAPDERMLQDVVTAIREGTTIDALGFRRERHADRHMKSAAEMTRLFRRWPHMIAATTEVVGRCDFSLDQLRYQYPTEATPGMTAQATLVSRLRAAEAERFPEGLGAEYQTQIAHELELIEQQGYAPYFLTVNAIVAFARGAGILCQGRGSAANSLVCYILGITSIDPIKHTLLFERFISGERNEPPDIDVDFEHERREEVIQWIYETYGHHHAALTAVVTRFRARGAVREVGKALGLPEDLTAALAGQVWGWSAEGVGEKHVEALNLDAGNQRIALTLELARRLIGTPRHLSQHPGGFVLTQDRLDDLVPIAPAAMADRRVIEWDKDDIETLKFMKVDILGLGMLGCMRRAFDLLENKTGERLDLASPVMQEDCTKTFAMISRADTLGTFQIESRAQMSMLPRLKPKEFYDIVIQVAIVRPGPIQGDMVHPYLRRREGKEQPEYPKPELEAVLKKTFGVPLFQEQAMKVAMVGAQFTAAEADGLRRAMATFKMTGGVSHYMDKMIEGMVANGYAREFAERTFKQIEGFGSYGFPESHAASFAKIAYASSWMKCHHPDVFCCALLNAQPMGFYAPAQIVRDARDHGVRVLPPCVNASRWDTVMVGEERAPSLLLEEDRGGGLGLREPSSQAIAPHPTLPPVGEGLLGFSEERPSQGTPKRGVCMSPLRLGLRLVAGLSNSHAAAIVAARGEVPFTSIEDVWKRSGVPVAALEKLAAADAFAGLGHDRRQALWRVRGLGEAPLPLFAHADAREEGREPTVVLRTMSEGREVVEDYRTLQLSLRAHPLSFLREEYRRRGLRTCAELDRVRDGTPVEVAGIILIRQKPGSAKGVLFLTIEDETGIANGILWPHKFEAQRRTVLSAAMIGIRGRVQREGTVIHVIADRIMDYTDDLRSVGEMAFPHRPGPGDGATHPGAPDRGDAGWTPKGRRDYHRPFRDGADPEEVIRVQTRDFR
ncbi:error-prone DNA polymerase [Sphingomonas montana]|uniref:error-prone DNA polymerase n=1 Tax=Sphingomonas montana TaxID=1843236 RepID=UPI00096CCC3B|nr:error-prone DNA polymerase [Sphingomonas montana]